MQRGSTRPGALRAGRPVITAMSLVLALIAMTLLPTSAAHAATGDFAWGTVSVDANKNGTRDAAGPVGSADKGVAGVKVEVLDGGGNPVADTTTGADGSWSIPAQPAGASGPFTVRIDTAGVNGDAYATETDTSSDNAFARVSGEPQQATAVLPATGEVNALVYPTWTLDLALAADPAGYQGKSVYTGTAPFDADGSQPGTDAGQDDAKVRTNDIVSYNWSLTAASDEALGDNFDSAILEQTITLGDGAVANFIGIPAACVSGTITALPSGTQIQPKVDPPVGTTSVVLTCNLGRMGIDKSAYILPTSVQVSANSKNGATFTTSARAYGVDATGTATAQPAPGVENGPIDITAAPRYDVEKRAGVSVPGQTIMVDGKPVVGTRIWYTVQISTDRKSGVEAFQQPITLEESLWGNRSVTGPGGETVGSNVSDLKWYLDRCDPSMGSAGGQQDATTVYGKPGVSNKADETNTVRNSGTCAIVRTGAADTGNYTLTLSGIDTSGVAYPTKTAGGQSLAAGPYYVASYRIGILVPNSELDRMQGTADDGVGEMSLFNRVGDFDPKGASGASNYGDGVEPGYCKAGPATDQATNCDTMEDGKLSNNVAGPTTIRISPGDWVKYILQQPRPWEPRPWATSELLLPGMGSAHDGQAQVQPGQTFPASIRLVNTGSQPMQQPQMCDVFDNTVVKLAPLANQTTVPASDGGAGYAPDQYVAMLAYRDGEWLSPNGQRARQSDWIAKYGHVDLTGDNPDTGVFDTATNRWEGDWSNQREAANGTNTICGSNTITWYDSPDQVPGGIDAVNVVWMQGAPGYELAVGSQDFWQIAFEQRDTYNGGPHAGEPIRSGTVAADFAAVKSSTFASNWTTADYVPGAGSTKPLPAGVSRQPGENGSGEGDRWTVARALMRLAKDSIAADIDGTPATGASAVGVTGAGVAGKPIAWRITSTLTAASDQPAPVENVVVTDTLPKYTVYNQVATEKLAAANGVPAPASATVNADGTTTLVWNLGTRTPNEDLPALVAVTDTDPLAPNNTVVVNQAVITADGITPLKAHTDDHTVRLEQTGELQLKKSVDKTLDLQNDDQKYTLQVKNFSETLAIQAPTVIDVLPYNGDGTNTANVNRAPASDYAGTNKLHAAPQAFEFDGTTPLAGTFYYTTVAPADVPQNLNADTDPSIWATTFTANATAIKFVAANSLATTSNASKSGLTITYTTDQAGNDAGDLYSNRFTAFSNTFKNGANYQLLTSNLTTVRVLGFSLGDLVWFDIDGDGKYTAGTDQTAPEGVKVDVYNAANAKVGTATTDADGRWVVNQLSRGSYYAVIPAAEFAAGGKLAGYAPAPNAVTDPNSNKNEDVDHHAVAGTTGPAVGGVRSSGLIVLDADTTKDPITGNGPLGDNVANLTLPIGTTDDFTNLTLDLALAPPATFTVRKQVDGAAGTFATGTFDIQVTCTLDGVTVSGFPKTVHLAGGGSEDITAPLGSKCDVVETGDGHATHSAVDPADGITLTRVTGNPDVTVTNTFDEGTLRIRKEVKGTGAAFTGGQYDFTVDCSFNGTDHVFTKDVTITDDGTGSMTSDVIGGIPVGAVCTITETDSGGADVTPAPVQVTIDDDDTAAQIAGFVNEFSAGTIAVEKALDGAAKDDAFLKGLSYQVLVTCAIDRDGGRVELYSGNVWVTPGTPITPQVGGKDVLVPVGAHCWGSETASQGAAMASVDHDSYANAVIVTKGNAEKPQQLALHVVNTFDQAQLTVTKNVVGPADKDAEYTFTLACTYPVTGDGTQKDESYPLKDADASFRLKAGQSRTITVAAGVTCTVGETNVPKGATVTIKDSDMATLGGSEDGVVANLTGGKNSVEVTNTFPTPDSPGGDLAFTGMVLPAGVVWAAFALLLTGGALLLLVRRRKSVGGEV